jgi:hypothetical protein
MLLTGFHPYYDYPANPKKKREPTSGLEPLTPAHYECAVRRCWALHRIANHAYVSGSLSSLLPTIAGYCVRVRVKLGSSGVGSSLDA